MCLLRKRVVLKFGTGILTRPGRAELDANQFEDLTAAVAGLVRQGHQPLIVSSGAVGAGLQALGLDRRPSDMATIQACAAVGQSRLMHVYDRLFSAHGLRVAQLLVTHADLETPERAARFRTTLFRLLEFPNLIPIINENDSVAVEELKYGDNDALSARLAALAHADQLILLTSADGLVDPETNRVIPYLDDPEEAQKYVRNEKGSLSVGGMGAKLTAVGRAVKMGVETMIASGRRPEQFSDLVAGGGLCTRFHVSERVGDPLE